MTEQYSLTINFERFSKVLEMSINDSISDKGQVDVLLALYLLCCNSYREKPYLYESDAFELGKHFKSTAIQNALKKWFVKVELEDESETIYEPLIPIFDK